ncbi:MAG: hypothetical protein A2V62_00270 [Nitrospirae bacterium RBG_19FT_COMBO_58_9]|nr:MAG: hypothetical protein A2V62_00270 [Nitrospirae bacterium RBG_19FT_COMBO_58_9]
MLLNDFVDDDGQARGWSADLKRRTGKGTDDQSPDNARDDTGGRWNAGGDGDTHAEGESD